MPQTTDIRKLVINKLTKDQYDAATKNADELYLTPDTTDQDIADAVSAHNSSVSAHSSLFNTKQDTLATQTAYSAKGSATKVPQITTNTLGQVTGITEVDISQPTVNDAILTIQQNGMTISTFSANASSAATANIDTTIVKFRDWSDE